MNIYIYIYLRKFWQGGWQMYTWALNLPDNIEGKRPESGTCRNPAICTSQEKGCVQSHGCSGPSLCFEDSVLNKLSTSNDLNLQTNQRKKPFKTHQP